MKKILLGLLIVFSCICNSYADYQDEVRRHKGAFLALSGFIMVLASKFSGRYELEYTDEINPYPVPNNAEVFSNTTGSIIYKRKTVRWLTALGFIAGIAGLSLAR